MTLNVLGTVKNAEDFEVVGMNPEVETAVAVGIALQAWLEGPARIPWTFECPIAPHLWSLLNREMRDVEQLRLWFRSIGRDPIWGTLGPQIAHLIS